MPFRSDRPHSIFAYRPLDYIRKSPIF
jgi:hypothetical protein